MAAARFRDPEPGALVERFSWEVEARRRTEADTAESDQLRADFLSERDRRERDRRRTIERLEEMFNATRSDDLVIFNKAKQQLLEAMKKFQDLVPGAKTGELPTSWSDVASAAFETQARLEAKARDSRSGRVKELVRKVFNGMNNHATALKMLPTESPYVSIVGGSVLMIIKAAANYINISEAFAKGMIQINDAVRLENHSHVYDTPVLQQITMRLYAQIFLYLIKFMTWYTDHSMTRLLKSFNETALRVFDDDLAQVKQVSTLLFRQIQLHQSADTRMNNLMLEELSGDLRYLVRFSEMGERQSRLRDAANAELLRSVMRVQFEKSKQEFREYMVGVMEAYGEKMRSGISGACMTDLLEQQASASVKTLRRPSSSHAAEESGAESIVTVRPSRAAEHSSESEFSRDLRFDSRHLEDYFDWEHVRPHLETGAPLLADATFVARLNSFTATMESQLLYAHGQSYSNGPDLLERSASVYKSLAEEAGAPVVSYFCELSHDDPPENRTRESVELSALICAMIRQLVNILPSQDADIEAILDAERFSVLDGTLRTWKEALEIFEDLISCVRLPLLIFVIHGLNVLEDESEGSTAKPLEDFVMSLVRIVGSSSAGEKGVVKVLFTTSGLSNTLCNVLDEEMMAACNTSASAGPKRPRAREVISY